MIDPALREQALERFRALGYPQRGDEAFKYTNVAPIAERAFAPGEAGEPRAATLPGLTAALVFVNGHLAARGASPYVAPLGADEHRSLVQAHLARVAAFEQFAFAAENTAKATDGALVHVRRTPRSTRRSTCASSPAAAPATRGCSSWPAPTAACRWWSTTPATARA
jgi:hypothetical protein